MTDWMKPPTGLDPLNKLSTEDMEYIRDSMQQRGYDHVAKQVRDHYSPKQYQPDTFVAYQGENPVFLALELLVTWAAEDLAQRHPDRSPADHEGSFLDHVDLLRAFVSQLGELQYDQLMDDKIWFWTNVASESEPSREQLVEDIRKQMEGDMRRQAQQWIAYGYDKRRQEERGEA